MSKYLIQVGEIRPGKEGKPGASKVLRHVAAKDGFPTPDVATLYEVFDMSAKKYASNKCLGYRPITDGKPGDYKWYTYAEVAAKVKDIASGLASIGIDPGQRVGVYGANCCEWMMVMQACNRMSYQCVPLYDSLGENAVEYIINHSEAVVTFAEAKKLPNLAKAAKGVAGQLKHVVYWGGAADAAAVEALKGAGLGVQSLEELSKAGGAAPADPIPPKPTDYCTIMYTSGTTGDPKGVLLTHSAVVHTVHSLIVFLEHTSCQLDSDDSMLSYLPLAHIFDRVAEEMFLHLGASIGYWQGDSLKLVDDIGALRPTMFIGVPRVFDRIYNRVKDQVDQAGGLKKILFNWAFERKKYWLAQGVPQAKASPFSDRLVFGKVKQRLGGRVKLIVSGGAPLAPHVEEWLKVAMCAPVIQGYGLTETCAGSSIAVPDVWAHFATNGVPTPDTEIRLESVPEMNYDAAKEVEPAGEVLIRGPQIFSGYYKMPEKTAEVLDSEGWFHTGDIGLLTKEGGLKIVDRKKNIFKLSQGEYIAVEKLEATFKKAPAVEQVWVYGDSFKSVLVAVVVPKEDALKEWAKEAGKSGSYAELAKLPEAQKWVLEQLAAAGKGDRLKGFEMIKAVHLDSEHFSVENDLLTPTFKAKRPQLQKKYQGAIDAMYKSLGQ